jgi:exosortase
MPARTWTGGEAVVASSASRPSHDVSGLWTFAIALAALWSALVVHLHQEWTLNPSYSYGWSVPFLAGYLFLRRWSTRPAASAFPRNFAIGLLVLAAALLLPLRLIAKANPDWRLISWTLALVLVAITFALLLLTGGRPWLKHFAFPILFMLVAVPWPTQLEQQVVQQLMRAVSAVDVELLNACGITALQQGNVIQLANGWLGMEDACSGIRSLQSSLMVSLFLGGFYDLPAFRRVLLVGAGVLLAFIFNLIRTFLLAWVGATYGIESIDAWHDPAGFGVLFGCLFSLWGVTLWLKRGTADSATVPSAVPVAFPRVVLIALVVWLVTAELASEAWFRFRPGHRNVAAQWTVAWPADGNQLRDLAISKEAVNLLRFNEGRGMAWQDESGKHWNLYSFKWLPGQTAARFVKVHRPEICLPASGLVAVGEPRPELIRFGEAVLPFRTYRFDDHGRPLHVFYCYWDGTTYESIQQMVEEDWTARGRLRRVWHAQKDRGAQILEIVVWGFEEDEAAERAIRLELDRLVKS